MDNKPHQNMTTEDHNLCIKRVSGTVWVKKQMVLMEIYVLIAIIQLFLISCECKTVTEQAVVVEKTTGSMQNGQITYKTILKLPDGSLRESSYLEHYVVPKDSVTTITTTYCK